MREAANRPGVSGEAGPGEKGVERSPSERRMRKGPGLGWAGLAVSEEVNKEVRLRAEQAKLRLGRAGQSQTARGHRTDWS